MHADLKKKEGVKRRRKKLELVDLAVMPVAEYKKRKQERLRVEDHRWRRKSKSSLLTDCMSNCLIPSSIVTSVQCSSVDHLSW